jgi:hypothetical protein
VSTLLPGADNAGFMDHPHLSTFVSSHEAFIATDLRFEVGVDVFIPEWY